MLATILTKPDNLAKEIFSIKTQHIFQTNWSPLVPFCPFSMAFFALVDIANNLSVQFEKLYSEKTKKKQ